MAIDTVRRDLLAREETELIFKENSSRWVLFPIYFPSVWEYYKKILAGFWTPDDFNWRNEGQQLRGGQLEGQIKALNASSLSILRRVLNAESIAYGVPSAHFAPLDTTLWPDILNLTCELTNKVQIPEARAFLGVQAMCENFHREVFTHCAEVLCDSKPAVERKDLGPTIENQVKPFFIKRQEWLNSHLRGFLTDEFANTPKSTDPSPLCEVLVTLVVQKAIFNTSLALVPTIVGNATNEGAIRKSCLDVFEDCYLHADFIGHLYQSLEYKLPPTDCAQIISEAADLEFSLQEAICTAGINKNEVDVPSLISHSAACLTKACKGVAVLLGLPDEVHVAMGRVPRGQELAVKVPKFEKFKVEHSGSFMVVPSEVLGQSQPELTDKGAQLELDADF